MSEILLVNPRKRRRKTATKRRTYARKRNPVRRKRRAVARRPATRRRVRRRNPSMRGVINSTVMPAVWGTAGALALDVALGYIPLPLTLKTGMIGNLVKAAGAIGIGMLASKTKLVKASNAADMSKGALTVMLHGIAKQQLATMLPNVTLGEYIGSGYNAGQLPMGYNSGSGLNAYLPDLGADDLSLDNTGLGEYMNEDGYGVGDY